MAVDYSNQRTTGRRIGKQMALIKMSAKKQTPILVKDARQRKLYREKARNNGIEIPTPLILNELMQQIVNSKEEDKDKYTNVLIDSSSWCLNELIKKYISKEIHAFPLCDYSLSESKCMPENGFTVFHLLNSIQYEYKALKIVDGNEENVLFNEEKNDDIIDHIPEELLEMITTDIILYHDGSLYINIGEVSNQDKLISQ